MCGDLRIAQNSLQVLQWAPPIRTASYKSDPPIEHLPASPAIHPSQPALWPALILATAIQELRQEAQGES